MFGEDQHLIHEPTRNKIKFVRLIREISWIGSHPAFQKSPKRARLQLSLFNNGEPSTSTTDGENLLASAGITSELRLVLLRSFVIRLINLDHQETETGDALQTSICSEAPSAELNH